ncbi:MAG: hypothetical protein GC192_21175 [Bacteroidetes bacterium]|nr:hypothetical protein [Bacteroidota bacterium]
MATQKSDLKLDGFVESVRPDPKSNEQVQLLQGYLGGSSEQGHVRLYFDEELNNFVDVPKADILHCVPNDKSENPLGGSRIWVKKATVVTFGDTATANRAKSSFLEGDLISAYGNLGIGKQADLTLQDFPGITPSQLPGCVSLGNGACITNNLPCRTIGIACNITGPISIGVPCIPSKFTICQTRFGIPCLVSIVKPSCLRTCVQPSCGRTCIQFTCNPRICDFVACRNASLQTGPVTTTVINPTVDINDAIAAQQQQMFQGAFNPFQTGGFGM